MIVAKKSNAIKLLNTVLIEGKPNPDLDLSISWDVSDKASSCTFLFVFKL